MEKESEWRNGNLKRRYLRMSMSDKGVLRATLQLETTVVHTWYCERKEANGKKK